jgi:hypothetical protein
VTVGAGIRRPDPSYAAARRRVPTSTSALPPRGGMGPSSSAPEGLGRARVVDQGWRTGSMCSHARRRIVLSRRGRTLRRPSPFRRSSAPRANLTRLVTHSQVQHVVDVDGLSVALHGREEPPFGRLKGKRSDARVGHLDHTSVVEATVRREPSAKDDESSIGAGAICERRVRRWGRYLRRASGENEAPKAEHAQGKRNEKKP